MKLTRNVTDKAFQAYEAITAAGGYCCCKIEKTEENRCMCKEFKEHVEDPLWSGDCECGLYHKEA